MKFKIKRKGLLFDKKKAFSANFRKVSVLKSALKSEDSIVVYFKGKKETGMIEFKRDELVNILKLSK